MLNINPIMEMMNSNNGLHRHLSKSLTIPTIQVELDEDSDSRKFSILYPESKRGSLLESEKPRKKRKSSFSTFQIIDENNCGM